MATISAQSRRRKQAVYGKTSRSVNTWNSTNLDALDEDELSIAAPTISRNANLTKSYSVQKRETKPGTLKPKPVKKREIKQDVWDVPSSESSDDEGSPPRLRTAPKFGGKGKSNQVQEAMKLAPWEQAKAEVLSPGGRENGRKAGAEVSKFKDQSAMVYNDEPAMPVESPSSNATKIGKEKPVVASPARSSPNTSSAAARLQARRLQSGNSATIESSKPVHPQKRTVQLGTTGLQPRKRIRSDNLDDDNVAMPDAYAPNCDSPEKAGIKDHTSSPKPNSDTGAAATKYTKSKATDMQRSRRGKLTTYSSPRKMESAPARLSEMLPVDTDTTDDTRSPSITASRPTTPQKYSVVHGPSSPRTAFSTSAGMKQSQLLSRLMPDEDAAPSPSALPMHALKIASARRGAGEKVVVPRTILKSSSDVGPQRTRLVDRLKASAMSSDEESSEEDSETSDIEMGDAGDREIATSNQSQLQSQSQSQTVSANSRPKFTYAATQISWLKEESLEEELMLDMPAATTQRQATFDRVKSASQKSAFDMDSDDDEGAAGKLRTIHELRAGGVNQRFMDDISGLLEDIANHNVTARSRRRSALLDIATKLEDKTFAAKFFRQGYEQQLMAECGATPDDIADFALATAIAVLMTAEPPEHAAQSLKSGGAISLLVRMLPSRTDPRKLAKERRNNMSKGAQSDFSRFVIYTTEQQSIWGDVKPSLATSRSIALKALDLLVGRLRREGDRSEIIDSEDIKEVMPSQTDVDAISSGNVSAEMALSVSVLESLSTTTASLAWPAELIELLRQVLTSPTVVNERSQHLRFLTLRLCLNLTNDKPKNCKAFAQPDTIIALLKSMVDGFEMLFADQEDSQRTINLDLLVLSMGIMINLTEQRYGACDHAGNGEATPLLATLVGVFLQGQQRMLQAESVEDGVTNVAFGYLAVVLANLCRNREARQSIASRLPGKKLTALVEAVQEFVVHHQKVDTLNFEGEEGSAVWSAFTEKLKGVLSRLRAEAEADEIDMR